MANSVWCWFLCLSVKSYVYIYFQVLATQYEGQRYYFERELIEVPDKIYKYKTKAKADPKDNYYIYIYIYWAVFFYCEKKAHIVTEPCAVCLFLWLGLSSLCFNSCSLLLLVLPSLLLLSSPNSSSSSSLSSSLSLSCPDWGRGCYNNAPSIKARQPWTLFKRFMRVQSTATATARRTSGLLISGISRACPILDHVGDATANSNNLKPKL